MRLGAEFSEFTLRCTASEFCHNSTGIKFGKKQFLWRMHCLQVRPYTRDGAQKDASHTVHTWSCSAGACARADLLEWRGHVCAQMLQKELMMLSKRIVGIEWEEAEACVCSWNCPVSFGFLVSLEIACLHKLCSGCVCDEDRDLVYILVNGFGVLEWLRVFEVSMREESIRRKEVN